MNISACVIYRVLVRMEHDRRFTTRTLELVLNQF